MHYQSQKSLHATGTSPLLSHPLCFLHSHAYLGLHLALSSPFLIHFLSTHPGLAKNHFSPPCTCQPVEHMHLLCLISTLLSPVSWQLDCLTLSSPPRHFQPAPLTPLSLSHFFIHQLHCRIVCSHFQCSLLYIPLLHHVCQLSLPSSHCSIFKIPTFMTVHLLPQFPLPLHSPSSFLRLVFLIVYHCYGFVCFGKKSFRPDALSARTLPIYLGLGPASGNTGMYS